MTRLVVYVNDNHGDWSAARAELVDKALAGREPSLVEPILPDPDLPFVVKARHSALDAYVRHFEVAVAPDAVAHIHADRADAALRLMERNMRADVEWTWR